jgi:hypothetical protein
VESHTESRSPLMEEMVEYAKTSSLKLMDRDGVPYGVEVVDFKHLLGHEPMVVVAGREVLITSPHAEDGWLWQLRLESFYCNSPRGLLYYYAPIPRNVELLEPPEEGGMRLVFDLTTADCLKIKELTLNGVIDGMLARGRYREVRG